MKKLRNFQSGPEAPIQEAVVKKLLGLNWLVKVTHGNIYQYGFPDLFCAHKSYGSRWIEVKRGDGKHSFTPAQLEFFPQFYAAGVGIWIVTDASQVPEILFTKPNFWSFLEEKTRR